MKTASEKKRTDFLTWLEAAAEFNISVRSLKNLAARGVLRRYKMAGLRETLISREELTRAVQPQPIGA